MDRRALDGPFYTTVLVVRDPIPKGLSHFIRVLQRTSTMDRHTLDGSSETPLLRVSRFASPTTLVFQFFYALGTIACLFVWGKVNGK